jgi:hypothetical protein
MWRAGVFFVVAAAACAQHTPDSGPPPDPGIAAIEKIRQRGLQYARDLPNFVCTQVTLRNMDRSGTGQKWKTVDTVEEDINYFGHHETYKVLSINGKPAPNVTHKTLKNLQSSGEFGSLLRRIFAPESQAEFHFERPDTLNGRPVQVISFRVERQNSVWTITRGRDRTVAGYHGLIFADSATDSVLRATVINEMPPRFPVEEAGMEIDYSFIPISGKEYLLPVTSVAHVREGKILHQNTIQFSRYRKFAADTQLRFDASTEPPELAAKPVAPAKQN